MSVDYPRAWQIVMSTNPEDHHPECSFRITDGSILCDCDVLMKHPDVLDKNFHNKLTRERYELLEEKWDM